MLRETIAGLMILASLGCDRIGKIEIKEPNLWVVCQYLDSDGDGKYDLSRKIRVYEDKLDTSLYSPIRFETQFGGGLVDRECSEEELAGLFAYEKYPPVNEIRFISFWETEGYKRKFEEAWRLSQELVYSPFAFDQHVRHMEASIYNPTEVYINGKLDVENFHYTERSLELAIDSFKDQVERLREGRPQFPPTRDFFRD